MALGHGVFSLRPSSDPRGTTDLRAAAEEYLSLAKRQALADRVEASQSAALAPSAKTTPTKEKPVGSRLAAALAAVSAATTTALAAASDGPGRKGEQEAARQLEASLASQLAGLATCGAGPRHLCLHPSGRLALVVLEMAARVAVYEYLPKGSRLASNQGPSGFSGFSGPSGSGGLGGIGASGVGCLPVTLLLSSGGLGSGDGPSSRSSSDDAVSGVPRSRVRTAAGS